MMLVHKEGYKSAAVEVAVFPPAAAEGIQAEDAPLVDEQVIEIELEPLQSQSAARHWQLY
jgi:hypothetical protein